MYSIRVYRRGSIVDTVDYRGEPDVQSISNFIFRTTFVGMDEDNLTLELLHGNNLTKFLS